MCKKGHVATRQRAGEHSPSTDFTSQLHCKLPAPPSDRPGSGAEGGGSMVLPNEPSPKNPAPCPGFCRNDHGRAQQRDRKLTKHKNAATTLQSQGQAPVMAGGWGARPAVEFHDSGPKNEVGHFSALWPSKCLSPEVGASRAVSCAHTACNVRSGGVALGLFSLQAHTWASPACSPGGGIPRSLF